MLQFPVTDATKIISIYVNNITCNKLLITYNCKCNYDDYITICYSNFLFFN